METSTSTPLSDLRKQMSSLGIDAFVVGSGDAHQSEYVHESDKRRTFISKFTGSAGTALILQTSALLWTDGRYFLQATMELSDEWTLMRSGNPGVLELNEWIAGNLPAGSIVAIDSFLVSTSQAKAMEKAFGGKQITLRGLDRNPIDEIWADRPLPPAGSVQCHDIALAGKTHVEKISEVQKSLEKNFSTAVIVSMLDEIAWLFNIRGSDVEFNPVVIAYAVVSTSGAHLFIDTTKVTEDIRSHLAGVAIHPYGDIEGFLVDQAARGRVLADPAQVNWRLYQALGSSVYDMPSPIALPKSLKCDAELEGIRQSHLRDGAALTAFLHWLEGAVKAAPGTISEYDVTLKIEEFRRRAAHHVTPSFSTIAGYGPNGAIIHYKPERDTAALLGVDSMFLLDSGAQYLDGTTDVTRTLHFGEPTQHMKDCFTLVLKGHIALARAVFPEGTAGSRLDAMARAPLWTAGLDYNHGTGHGVGAFLNVHEGPQGIGFRPRVNEAGFFPGMTTSNEPGYYEEGNFGIRIENVCITVPATTAHNFGGKRFCKFETVTMTPIKKNLVNTSMLDDDELQWLNEYHSLVRDSLLPLIESQFPESVDYLIAETEPLKK